jgi:hypothetical protein
MSENGGYLGDLEKTQAIWNLCQVAADLRDEKWKARFLGSVAEASFRCGDPQVIEGPDGFPYFQLLLPEPDTVFQCYVLDKMKDEFLLDHGLGVAINPDRGNPDWVFSYGDIVNYRLTGEFYSPVDGAAADPRQEVIGEEQEALVGQPSEEYLPTPARRAIREHLLRLGVRDPKVVLMSRAVENSMVQELVFNLSPDRFPSEEHYRAVMHSLAWFLPRHYTYVSLRGSALEDRFEDL